MLEGREKLQHIFAAAIEIEGLGARQKFVEQACQGDVVLMAEVEGLLNAYQAAGSFMEEPIAHFGNQSDGNTADDLGTDRTVVLADGTKRVAGEHPESESKHLEGSPDSDLTLALEHLNLGLPIGSQLPRRFGAYELLEEIAQGGMGVVFKARQISLGRIVAVKMILAGQFAGQEEIKRFQIEAEAAGKLDHPGIVPVFDVGCHDGQHYFSMAYVEGQSLSAKIKAGPLSPREAAVMTSKLSVAIQAAHDSGVVHRDLKPGNVLLDQQNEPRITDFGLAKRVEGDSELTTTGMVLGTPSFMPPEQAAGKEIDAAADIYSLGAMLYAMVTGRAPFEGGSQLDTLINVLQNEPVRPREIDKSIPRDLEVICLKCLEKKKQNRYASGTELSADLHRFLAGEPIRAKNDVRRLLSRWMIREPVLAAHLIATLVMIAILVVNLLIFGERGGLEYNQRMLGVNIGILGGWAFVVFLFQKIQNRFQTKSLVPFAWAGINPIFLTVTLAFNDEPRELLVSLYFLLIVTCCFFRRVELVAITTVFSLIGYIALVYFCFEESQKAAPSYLVVHGATIMVVGVLLGLLTHRMKRLGEKNEAKPA